MRRSPKHLLTWRRMSKICTEGYVKAVFSKGKWGPTEVVKGTSMSVSCLATGIGYAQSCFEGMRAHKMKDGIIRVVSPHENYKRLINSCRVASITPPPETIFNQAIKEVIPLYARRLPDAPAGTSLYLRPLIFGSSPNIRLSSSEDFIFIVACTLLNDLVENDVHNPAKAIILNLKDRAAIYGTGQAKIGANYVHTIGMTADSEKKGYNFTLFMDPKTNKYVEEFSTSNFVGIIKPKAPDGCPIYVTPRSPSILESIVNKHLSTIASKKFGWEIVNRRIAWDEIASGVFSEVVAVGTAVNIAYIGSITRQYPDPKFETEDWIEPVYGKIDQPKVDPSAVFRVEEVSLPGAAEKFPLSSLLKKAYLDILKGNYEDWDSYGIMTDPSEM